MSFIGFLVAMWLFFHFKAKIRRSWKGRLDDDGPRCGAPAFGDPRKSCGPWDWDDGSRHRRRHGRSRDERGEREAVKAAGEAAGGGPAGPPSEEEIRRRARRRAGAEVGFYTHLTTYCAVIALLAFINMMTSPFTPWFLWPAFGWGIGIFFHWMGVFGSRILKEQVFDPAVEREVRREKAAMTSEKQASIDELSSTIAHEIRNPIAAAKSLVQQIGEDPASPENVEYGKVALEELERVERSISHLLKYAKEEDYRFERVNLANVVDSALTQLRAKLDEAKIAVARNYITGPVISGDGEKLRQVFANLLDNAIDALEPVAEGRRIDLFVENGRPDHATVRVRDNGAGIAPEKLEKVFNPFFTTKDDGTGLGLAISRKIVEAHEGSIEAVSEVGRGTEFRVFLPLPPKGTVS